MGPPPRTRYLVIERNSAPDLLTHVQQLLDEGWELQGGVSVALRSVSSPIYAQAMTIIEPD